MKKNDSIRPDERSFLTRLRDLLAPVDRRPRRSFVPRPEACETRGLMSGLLVAAAAAVPSGGVPAPTPVIAAPEAAVTPLVAATDVAPADDSTDPPPVPVDPLLGTVSWG